MNSKETWPTVVSDENLLPKLRPVGSGVVGHRSTGNGPIKVLCASMLEKTVENELTACMDNSSGGTEHLDVHTADNDLWPAPGPTCLVPNLGVIRVNHALPDLVMCEGDRRCA